MRKTWYVLVLVLLLTVALVFAQGCGQTQQTQQEVPEVVGEGEQEVDYPTRPIELVVPYAPGGMSDLIGRTLAAGLPDYLGQPVVVVNKDGGGGMVGANYAAKSDPDGYTIIVQSLVSALPEYHRRDVTYKAADFVPVAITSLNVHGIAVHKDSPFETIEDLVEHVKANPKSIKYSTTGTGTFNHVFMLKLSEYTGMDWEMVPVDNDAAAVASLVGKHIDCISINLSPLVGLYESGDIRILAVTAQDRLASMPEIPTLWEKYDLGLDPVFTAVYAPAEVDPKIIKILENAIEKVVTGEKFIEVATNSGLHPQFIDQETTIQMIDTFIEKVVPFHKEQGLID